MKELIGLIFLGMLFVDCQSQTIDIVHLNQVNKQLNTMNLIPDSLSQKITSTCQRKSKEENRALSREEYFTILRNETFEALPEELKQHKQVLDMLDNTFQNINLDSIPPSSKQKEAYWALPLPNTFGSLWINTDEKAMTENRQQGQALIKLLEDEKLIDEKEYVQLSQEINKRSFLFQHQLYDLILKKIRTITHNAVSR